jgi:hypothetical protein
MAVHGTKKSLTRLCLLETYKRLLQVQLILRLPEHTQFSLKYSERVAVVVLELVMELALGAPPYILVGQEDPVDMRKNSFLELPTQHIQ